MPTIFGGGSRGCLDTPGRATCVEILIAPLEEAPACDGVPLGVIEAKLLNAKGGLKGESP